MLGTTRTFLTEPDLDPKVITSTVVRSPAPGYVFVTPRGPMIVDDDGSLVWIHPSKRPATNLQVQEYQGKPVLTWWEGDIGGGKIFGVGLPGGEAVMMDSTYKEVARIKGGDGLPIDLHEFTLTPQGTALFTAYTEVKADLSSVGGPSRGSMLESWVVERDVASGKVLLKWRSSDHIALTESYSDYSGSSPHLYTPVHVNSISLLPDGNLLIGARNTWAVYKVDRKTGKIIWRLGGKKSDFAIGKGARFAWQHDVNQQRDGSLTVFDNGAGDYQSQPQSRGLLLDVDERARRVSLSHQYLHPRTHLQAGALGSVQVLSNDHVFVGWGIEAAFTEFSADGEALLDGRLEGQVPQSYRAFRLPWTGAPAEPPAVAVDRHGQAMAVHVSWNGDTQARDWLVLGGDHPSTLAPIGKAERRGFETVIDVPRHAAHVAVTALEAGGRRLGRSKVLAV